MKQERPKDTGKACRVLKISRSSLGYVSVKADEQLGLQLQQLSALHPEEGFWKYYHRLRNAGEAVNHKRVHRVYKQMQLTLRRKCKKRLPARVKEPLEAPACFTHTWSIDFMSDVLASGRKFRSFHVIDDYNREVLFIETDYSLKSSRVIWVLSHLVNRYGRPKRIRMDNGPEFVAGLAQSWSRAQEIEFKYIQPGKPTQNAYVERFNRTYRAAVLDSYIFESIDQVRQVGQEWVEDYNHHRPHDALKGISPVAYRRLKEEVQGLPSRMQSNT